MADNYSTFRAALNSPAENAVAVVLTSTTDLSFATRGVYVGTGGDLVCALVGSTVMITFTSVQSGSIMPLRITRCSTTCTCSNVVALW